MKTQSVLPQALSYFEGLFATERNKRNIERMCERTGHNYQSSQHFLSDSPWSASKRMQGIALNTDVRCKCVGTANNGNGLCQILASHQFDQHVCVLHR